MLADTVAMTNLVREVAADFNVERMRRRLERVQREPDQAVYVALDPPHGVIALIHLAVQVTLLDRPFCEIGALFIAKPHRRQGHGRELLAHAQRWAARRGLDDVVARVPAKNSDARAFLQRCGLTALHPQQPHHLDVRLMTLGERTVRE